MYTINGKKFTEDQLRDVRGTIGEIRAMTETIKAFEDDGSYCKVTDLIELRTLLVAILAAQIGVKDIDELTNFMQSCI